MKINSYPGKLKHLGVNVYDKYLEFAVVCRQERCGVALFHAGEKIPYEQIDFTSHVGDLHSVLLLGVPKDSRYCFYEMVETNDGDSIHFFEDENACWYGEELCGKQIRLSCIPKEDFDWENDQCPKISYEDMICYGIHAKGFTMHESSKVTGRGTFYGMTQKLEYLKQLGVTTIELQPAYELQRTRESKDNYWGYVKGCYYAPRQDYCYSENGMKEFKELVQKLHSIDMELIMQFYFTEDMSLREIGDILRYWTLEYHVDGFHLMGSVKNIEEIRLDPALERCKLWYYCFEARENLNSYQTTRKKADLATFEDSFYYDMRRFLKGDEGMIQAVMKHILWNSYQFGVIKHLTSYEGFTLMDLVSYERKHNEANGEDNKDGMEYNASWNCGVEGISKKQTIQRLRLKQIKNALLLLLLSQGTPYLFMGDEMGRTQMGNNNPYNQDNETTWLNWELLKGSNSKKIYQFTKDMIEYRRRIKLLRWSVPYRMMDYHSCGYPDCSYHGEFPWKPDTSRSSRQLGILYCGEYTKEPYLYIAYNMHWEEHEFTMPVLPKGYSWHMILATDIQQKSNLTVSNKIGIMPRNICIFEGKNRE